MNGISKQDDINVCLWNLEKNPPNGNLSREDDDRPVELGVPWGTPVSDPNESKWVFLFLKIGVPQNHSFLKMAKRHKFNVSVCGSPFSETPKRNLCKFQIHTKTRHGIVII